jgi:hypothetical protein
MIEQKPNLHDTLSPQQQDREEQLDDPSATDPDGRDPAFAFQKYLQIVEQISARCGPAKKSPIDRNSTTL